MTRLLAAAAATLTAGGLIASGLTACSTAPPARRSVPAGREARGTIRTVAIPGRRSGFRARRAVVYLPSAARRPDARLPVVMLLGGNPSTPKQWIGDWHLAAMLDRFAQTHGGRAPIVVMPDENGTYRGDTECVDSTRGNAEQYLTVDVRDYVLAHYPASRTPSDWAVGGVSEGGMCAAVLALRHPALFRAFANLSGLARPTIGERDRPAATIAALFAGSRRAFDAHDAVWLLGRRHYPGLAGWLGAGSRDASVVAAQAAIAAAARRDGVPITRVVLPGGHGLGLWLRMLPAVFDWLWPRLNQLR